MTEQREGGQRAALAASARITYVGHATVVVDLDGVRLITDPVLRPRVMHLRRSAPVPADALRGIDAVLLSHGHWDHLDLPSLERLGKELPIVCPQGVTGLLRRKRFAHVTSLEIDDVVSIGEVEVRGVHAEHDGSRGPLGASGELGYVVTGSRSVYFAGDTDLFDGMADLPSLDVALLPVSGWGSKVGAGPPRSRARSRGALAHPAPHRHSDPLGDVLDIRQDGRPGSGGQVRSPGRRARA